MMIEKPYKIRQFINSCIKDSFCNVTEGDYSYFMNMWRDTARMKVAELKMDADVLFDMSENETNDINAGLYAYWALDCLCKAKQIEKDIKRTDVAETSKTPSKRWKLTCDNIMLAREYPVTALIQFNSNGKSTAFCHDDKNPSLSLNKKSNKAHCFVCGRGFNPIDILMYRDGYTFSNAVHFLCHT